MIEAEATITDDTQDEPSAPSVASKASRRPAPGGTRPRLSGAQWVEVVSMARAGVPVGKVAKIFKCKPSTIYRGLRKRGVNLAAYQAVVHEVQESAERRELIERVKKTKDGDYKLIDQVQKIIAHKVAEAQTGRSTYAEIADPVKTLKIAIDAIGNGTKIKWMILGLDKMNENVDLELPELPIREMSPDEVAALRDRQILEDENLNNVEVFDDDDEIEDDGVIAEGDEDPPTG